MDHSSHSFTRHPDSRLHVLTVTPFYPSLENETNGCFVAEPLASLQSLGVTHTVLAVQPFYRSRRRPSLSAVTARWSHYFALPSSLGLAWSGAAVYATSLPWVRRIHRANPIHLIHAHAALPCGHGAELLSRELQIPFVVTVHGLDAYFGNQAPGMAGRWCRRVSQAVYASASRVICISEKVRERVLEGASPAAQTSVIYNSVDPQRFFPPSENHSDGAILSVGNLIPIKGHALLLRAYAAVQPRFPGLGCEIIGEGPEHGRLRQLAASLGIASKVRFLGCQSRDQVAAAMRRCILFALPSGYEGLGCVYLEAMASQKAVIGCRGQGIEEIIRDRTNGCLIEPEDLPGLTATLATILEDHALRLRMGTSARQTVLENLTLDHQAARMLQLFNACASRD